MIMIWGAFPFDCRTTLVVIRDTITAQRYVDDILRTALLPFLLSYPGLIFQQDNFSIYGTCCYELSYSFSNTSLESQITRSLFNQACLGYIGKAIA
ncbi:UNVERIFIED_CONTAM: hypothetical protein NCL1_48092 [Trichonephila clavipes]